MAFNFALFIKHPDPEYLTFHPDFVNPELGTTGYNSAYMDTLMELGNEMAQKVGAGLTDGQFILHADDPTTVTLERNWASIEACRDWIDIVTRIHSATDCPLPLEAKVVNKLTSEETIIYPV